MRSAVNWSACCPESQAALVVHFAELFFSKAPPDFAARAQHRRLGPSDAAARSAFWSARSRERVDVAGRQPDDRQRGVDRARHRGPYQRLGTPLHRGHDPRVSALPAARDRVSRLSRAAPGAGDGQVVDRGDPRRSRASQGEPRATARSPGGATQGAREQLRAEITRRLQDVVRATDDFHPMRNALNDVIAELAERARDLPRRREELDRDPGLPALAARRGVRLPRLSRATTSSVDPSTGEQSIIVEPGSGMGILRNEADSALRRRGAALPSLAARRCASWWRADPPLIISKTNAESTVHRRARMDYIGIKKLDDEGQGRGRAPLHRDSSPRALTRRKPSGSRSCGKSCKRSWTRPESGRTRTTTRRSTRSSTRCRRRSSSSLRREQIGADVHTVLNSVHTDDVHVTLRRGRAAARRVRRS